MGIAATIAAVLMVGTPPAAAPRHVVGVVVDEAGRPVELAEISIDEGTTHLAQAVTGADGRFSIDIPGGADAAGTSVTVSAVRADDGVYALAQLPAGDWRIVLATGAADIVVAGRRISSAYTPQRIGKLEILTDPVAKADALLAVANLPGSTNAESSADIQLRGSAASLSRAYFNDVPLYEVVRGSSVDRATRGFSVLNSSIVQDVEVYASNPPLYLANGSGGAVRILPDDEDSGVSTAFVSLAGSGVAKAIPVGNRTGLVQTYANVTDLAPLLTLNPALKDVTRSFRASSVGASTSVEIGRDTTLVTLNAVDVERGRYVLGADGPSTDSDRRRSYNLATVEHRLASIRAKLDVAYTVTGGRQRFGTFSTTTDNSYRYVAIDAAGGFAGERGQYRVGLSDEAVALRSRSDLSLPAIATEGSGLGAVRRSATQTATYGYASYAAKPWFSMALGARIFLRSGPSLGDSYQATASGNRGAHKIVVGAGTYSSAALPEGAAFGRILPSRSRQISIDYVYDTSLLRFSVGYYRKADHVGTTSSSIHGFDAAVRTDPTDRLSLTGSITSVGVRINNPPDSHPADNDLPYLIRLGAKWTAFRSTSLGLSFVQRSGTPYTPPGPDRTVWDLPFDLPEGASRNSARLARYSTLDINLVHVAHWWPSDIKPVAFLSVSNALDRTNPANVYLDANRIQRTAFYQRRAVTIGMVVQL